MDVPVGTSKEVFTGKGQDMGLGGLLSGLGDLVGGLLSAIGDLLGGLL